MDIEPELARRLLSNIRGSLHPGIKPSSRLLNEHLFDEAQSQVLKGLAPFWAGFVKRYKAPDDRDEGTHCLQKSVKKKRRIVVAERRHRGALNAETGRKQFLDSLYAIICNSMCVANFLDV